MRTQGLSRLERWLPAPAPWSECCHGSRSAPSAGAPHVSRGTGSQTRIGSSPTGGLAGFL